MKKIFILGMAALLFFGFTSWAMALESAQFYAIDSSLDSGTSVTLSISDFTSSTYTLWYDTGSGWTAYVSGALPVNANPSQLVKFGLGNASSPTITTAILTFQGPDGPNLYHTVIMNFGDAGVTIATADGLDHVVPTPLPGTAWLFGAGLMGFVGILRRKNRA
jgi:hypothetical protein